MTIGEIHDFADLGRWAGYYGRSADDGPLDGLHMPTNFGLLAAPWTAPGVRAHVDALEAALPDGAWPNYVLGNHDEQRLATRVGPENVRLAALLLLALRGTPTLYYGDELGMLEVDVPGERRRDPWGERSGHPELSRDGSRTPMAWDDSPSAGFSDAPPGGLWLPLHPGHAARNVESQAVAGGSTLRLYQRALAVRNGSAALRVGDYRPLDVGNDDVFAFERIAREQRVVALLNFGDSEVTVDVPEGYRGGSVLIATDRPGSGGEPVGDWLALGGKAGALVA